MIFNLQKHLSYLDEQMLKTLKKNLGNRRVVIYGAGRNAEDTIKTLKKCSENIDIIVCDSACEKINTCCGYEVKNPLFLKNKVADFYVVVSIVKEYGEIRDLLHEYGYNNGTDYFYYSIPVDNESIEIYENYTDDFGNRVIGNLNGAKVRFRGRNSTIKIGKNFKASKLVIDIASGCNITIGDNFKAFTNLYFCFEDYAKLIMGNDVDWYSNGCELIIRKNADAVIEDKCKFGECNKLVAAPNTSLHIGKDALFSKFITIRTSDGHLIYDVKSGKQINCSNERRSVDIKDHVWVGEGCMILYNTVIGNGCIVGAKSLVKGKFPNNCIIAGHMAKIIKRDVTWSQFALENGMYDLPEEYRMLTDENK